MPVRNILSLGNPNLLEKSTPLDPGELELAKSIGDDLRDTMRSFLGLHGWGRAIAAPQIGVPRRIIFMEADKPRILINPVISSVSKADTIELWDDCMSFPDLLVKVRRHQSCCVTYWDELWHEQTIDAEGALSELFQHEIDHLDGILATMRAIDGSAFSLRSEHSERSERET